MKAFIIFLLLCTSVMINAATLPTCWLPEDNSVTVTLPGFGAVDSRRYLLQTAPAAADTAVALFRPFALSPAFRLVAWPGLHAAIYAKALTEASRLNGHHSAVLLLDISGKLWSVRLTARGFALPELLADLHLPDWVFLQAFELISVRLPGNLLTELHGPVQQRWVILSARHLLTSQDKLMVFRLPQAGDEIVRFSDLIDRTELTDLERADGLSIEQWQRLQRQAGWWLQLDGQIRTAPLLAAGVIYSAVVPVRRAPRQCADEQASQQLYAVHLYTGGRVYPARRLAMPAFHGKLALQANEDGHLSLWLQGEETEQLLLPSLLSLSPACADCVMPLPLSELQRWQRLTSYKIESGAH